MKPDAATDPPVKSPCVESKSTAMSRVCAGLSASEMVTVLKGETVALSFTAWPLTVPPMIGASFTLVLSTVVVLSVVAAATPSSALMVKVVVSVLFTATRLLAGSKTSARMAVVACAPVPVKVYTPPPASTKPLAVSDALVNTPLAAVSSVTLMSSVVLGSASAIVTPEKGLRVALSFTACPALAPVMVGASFTFVLTTVVVLLVTAVATPSSTATPNVVVSVAPLATRLSVGLNTNCRIAVVACAAVPEKV